MMYHFTPEEAEKFYKEPLNIWSGENGGRTNGNAFLHLLMDCEDDVPETVEKCYGVVFEEINGEQYYLLCQLLDKAGAIWTGWAGNDLIAVKI